VRQILLQSERRPGRVKEVGLAHGFWHLGRFAKDYRSLFGEFPSETASPTKRRSAQ
jgi:transcriptional regulator GlxA family with amidase domain